MLRRSIGLLALASAALATTPALAKGPDRARVCGSAHCVTIRGERSVSSLFAWGIVPAAARSAPRPAPYYSIRIAGGGSDVRWTVLYVPSRHAIRISQNRVPPYRDTVGPYWTTLSRSDQRVFRHAVRSLRPLAAPGRWA
jgi:hypothetical protein